MNYAKLGKRIRDERLLLRLTLEQLAEKIDKSSNFVGQIERNTSKPSLETIVAIANALGTTVDSLLSDNLSSNETSEIKQINSLLSSAPTEKQKYILDTIQRYLAFHN